MVILLKGRFTSLVVNEMFDPSKPYIIHHSGQVITTSADVTLNGGLIRELPQNPLNSGLGIILICPDHSKL